MQDITPASSAGAGQSSTTSSPPARTCSTWVLSQDASAAAKASHPIASPTAVTVPSTAGRSGSGIAPTSPFDGIRRTTPEGREYWSARDLMPLLGYDSWRRFADAIKRAKIAAHTSGRDVTSNFAGAVKISETKPAEDHHLSRFACYLIAMSGDPRKPEIAAALAYFAIRTREAETATSDLTQLSRRDILLMALEAEDRADQQQARAEVAERERDELAPVAGKFLDAEGDLSVRDAAQALTRAGVKVGQNRLFALLDERYGWIKRAVGDGRYRVIQSAIESGYMSVIPQSHYHPKTGVLVLDAPQPRVTPKGVQRILVDHGGAA